MHQLPPVRAETISYSLSWVRFHFGYKNIWYTEDFYLNNLSVNRLDSIDRSMGRA